jgi:hypothetical protein
MSLASTRIEVNGKLHAPIVYSLDVRLTAPRVILIPRKQQWTDSKQSFTLVYFFALSSISKLEATCSSETSVDFQTELSELSEL